MPLYCSSCGAANEEFATYCASCGEDLSQAREKKDKSQTTSQTSSTTTSTEEKKLLRSREDKMVTGLSAGLAKYLDMDVDLVRLIWVIAFLVTGGTAIVIYLVMALAIPLEPETIST